MSSERERDLASRQGLITVEFKGDMQLTRSVPEEDIFVGKRFGVGHHADVGRNAGMEVEIIEVNRKGESGPIESVRVERVKGV